MEITLRAHTGREQGSRASRRLRREGLVPGTVYGSDLDPIAVAVDHRELNAALHTEAGLNVIISLDVEGGETITTFARQIQRHPFRAQINHVDFLQISLTEKVQGDVSLDFVGEPIGVRDAGAILETIRTTVTVEALATDIPSSIAIDVSGLDVNDTITVASLPVIDGVEYIEESDAPLASVSLPAAILAEEEEEGVEGEEGEEGFEGEETAEGAEDGEADGE